MNTRQWQPIETAKPESHRPTLVFCEDAIHNERMDERWMLAEFDGDIWRVYLDGQRLYPTHWMPLPEPPNP